MTIEYKQEKGNGNGKEGNEVYTINLPIDDLDDVTERMIRAKGCFTTPMVRRISFMVTKCLHDHETHPSKRDVEFNKKLFDRLLSLGAKEVQTFTCFGRM